MQGDTPDRRQSKGPGLIVSDDLEKGKYEDEDKAKPRVLPSISTIKEYFHDYCNATAIHGVRYLAENKRNPIEKVFWIIALTMCMTGCYLMIMKVKEKLDTTPVLVTFAETATNIWHIPFAAVTVCPETKSRKTVFNFTKYSNVLDSLRTQNLTVEEDYTTISDEIRQKLDVLGLACLLTQDQRETAGLGKPIEEDALKFLHTSTIKLDSESSWCAWEGREVDGGCNGILKPVWSEEGVCFSFNMMPDSLIYKHHVINNNVFGYNESELEYSWDPDKGYSLNAGLKSRPWRASGAGSDDPGLNLGFSEEAEDVDYVCREGTTGYKIILHSPVEMPLLKHNLVISVPLQRSVTISLSPAYMTTSPGLEKYDPHKRQCYFSHEKYLKHFNYYTKKSCEIECIANATLKLCGCVPFYLPRDSSTYICGSNSENCASRAAKRLKKSDIRKDLERRAAGELPGSFISECDCLPSCVSLEYEADVTQTKLAVEKSRRAKGIVQDQKRFYSEVFISFKDSQFISNRRSELYGRIDFLANCGGILGLFSGFSIVSLIELIYFLTIRIWSNMYRRWKHGRRAMSRKESRPTRENEI